MAFSLRIKRDWSVYQVSGCFNCCSRPLQKADRQNVYYGSGVSIGYLAIHTFGLLMGTLLLPPSPSAFRRLQKQVQKSGSPPVLKPDSGIHFGEQERRQPGKAAIELFSYATAWWSLLGVLALCLPPVSTLPISLAKPVDSIIQHQSTISRRLVRPLLFFKNSIRPYLNVSFKGKHALRALGGGLQHKLHFGLSDHRYCFLPRS